MIDNITDKKHFADKLLLLILKFVATFALFGRLRVRKVPQDRICFVTYLWLCTVQLHGRSDDGHCWCKCGKCGCCVCCVSQCGWCWWYWWTYSEGERQCVQEWVLWVRASVSKCGCTCGGACAWGHHTNLFSSPSSPPAYQVDITDHRSWFHTCTSL